MTKPVFRRVSAYLIACFALFTAAVALLPWFLAPVLRGVGRHWGAEFGTYERVGYTHFALEDLHLRTPGLHVAVSRLEAPTPALWLWLHCTGKPEEIVAGSWSVDVQGQEKPPAQPASKEGWLPLRTTLRGLATALDTWLQRASIGPGKVTWPGGSLRLTAASWKERSLNVPFLDFSVYQGSALISFPANTDLVRVSLATRDKNGSAEITSDATTLGGDLLWWNQPLHLVATFSDSGWLPSKARLEAKQWELPGAVIKSGERYATIQGEGLITWQEGAYSAEASVQGIAKNTKNTPPFELVLKGSGNLSSFTLETAHAMLPGITMDLSAPVTIDRQGKLSRGEANFTLLADLEKQAWLNSKGSAKGLASLTRDAKGEPLLNFTLALQEVRIAALAVKSLQLKGLLQWPLLTLSQGELLLSDSERIEATGAYDFSTHELLESHLKGQLSGKTMAPWLPKGCTFDTAKFTGQAKGPLADFVHSGSAEVKTLTLRALKPLTAQVQWSGHSARIEQFTTVLSAGATQVFATGSLQSSELGLTTLTLVKDKKECLRLVSPALLSWKDGFSCESFQLEGQGKALLAVNWAEAGTIKGSVQKLSSRWFEELLSLQGPAWQLETLALDGSWNKGPATFSLKAAATLELGEGQNASLELLAQGDKEGLQVKDFTVKEGALSVLKAEAHIPLLFFPTRAPAYTLQAEGPLRAELSTGEGALFWKQFSELTGLEIKAPQADLQVEGTWAHPLGSLHLQVATLSLDKGRFDAEYPSLQNLDLVLTGDKQQLNLEKLVVSVEGQAVQAQGKLPLEEGNWSEVWADPLAFARRGADWSLKIPAAELSSFARFLPPFIAPKGRFNIDLKSKTGGIITGTLILHDAASRPLGSLGVLQEINAEVGLEGRSLKLRGVTSKLGGQLLTLSGTVDYPEDGIPRYALLLKGENLPFVRQSGLLVRGDVDLSLQSSGADHTLLQGTVGMQDSLFFSDLKSLIPQGGKGASPQAPYFAVSQAPFSAWQLDLTLSGKGFMRIRTPVFTAVASAQFHLGGTLGDPKLLGEARIEEGQVLMPFASLSIMEGYARITEAKPHELGLYMRATGRRYNYELGMELRGSVDDPRVTFTSSPPLASEQLMLMVMTGSAPANEIVFSSGQRLARIGTYLGQTLLGNLSGNTGGASRISVSSGEKVSRQGRETYEVQYKLNERWKWVGEYDEFDDFNLGLKWRLYPGKAKETK